VLRLTVIPVSIPQTRTALMCRESRLGLFRQVLSTSRLSDWRQKYQRCKISF
jgi:hypothetical protein